MQDGLLSLDEPVAKTLQEWAGEPAKATVTLRQLLQLTSGLGCVFPAPDFDAAVAQPFSASTGHSEYAAAPFQAFGGDGAKAPGSRRARPGPADLSQGAGFSIPSA